MDIENLQNDLYTVDDCYRTWAMRPNVENCKVMHFGKTDPKSVHCITDDSGSIRDIETRIH